MAALAVLLVLTLSAPAPLTVSKRNAAADRVATLAKQLGIDFDEKSERAQHPAPADREASSAAGFATWLDSQITNGTDVIDAPPAALRQFLRDRDEALWGVIAALEKDAPQWEPEEAGQGLSPRLSPTVRLEKLLLSAALVEERDGHSIEAGRALEASWSLGRAVASERTLTAQQMSAAVEGFQAGTVRKLHDTPLQWQSRLSAGGPFDRMLDAVAAGGHYKDPVSGTESAELSEASGKAYGAVADALRKIGPCGLAALSNDQVWEPAVSALSAETNSEKRLAGEAFRQVATPNITSAIRRAARVEVDRELTLKVLRLRLEKEGSRDRRWPERLTDPTSTVCASAAYAYRATGSGMELRFEGEVDTPSMGAVLPLTFRVGKPQLTPAPTATPTPTPTPSPTPEEPLDSGELGQDDGPS
jgi:hypothetical protein